MGRNTIWSFQLIQCQPNQRQNVCTSVVKFINKTIEIREELSFARLEQITKAVQLLCSDAYGAIHECDQSNKDVIILFWTR